MCDVHHAPALWHGTWHGRHPPGPLSGAGPANKDFHDADGSTSRLLQDLRCRSLPPAPSPPPDSDLASLLAACGFASSTTARQPLQEAVAPAGATSAVPAAQPGLGPPAGLRAEGGVRPPAKQASLTLPNLKLSAPLPDTTACPEASADPAAPRTPSSFAAASRASLPNPFQHAAQLAADHEQCAWCLPPTPASSLDMPSKGLGSVVGLQSSPYTPAGACKAGSSGASMHGRHWSGVRCGMNGLYAPEPGCPWPDQVLVTEVLGSDSGVFWEPL